MSRRHPRSTGFRRPIVRALAVAVVAVASPALAAVTFVDVTSEKFPDGLSNGHYLWGDCDGDGDDDLLVGGKTLYLCDGEPEFTFDRATDTGDLSSGPHSRALWVDIDNDGDLDLFGIGGGDNERLYRNEGDCTFTDISDFDGDGDPTDMGDGAPSTTATTGDFDGDGLLDLYVGNYERHCVTEPVTICGDCMTDRLWHNLGDGTFEDVTVSSGIYDQEHAKAGYCNVAGTPCTTDADCAPYPDDSCKSGTCARGSNWVDYDNDGDQDIFVSNYRLDPNLLWENDGLGNFTEVAEARNVDGDEDSGSWGHVLGTDWADYDNDGDMDLYTANLAHGVYVILLGHDISQLLENGGPPSYDFTDTRPSSGMRPYDPYTQPDWAETNPAWADYDNDGDLDIYVTHIYTSHTLNFSTLYSSDGDGTFTETTDAHGADLGIYRNYSAAWCDFDQDGDLDLVTYGAPTPDGSATARLYRNDGGNALQWLHVRPIGQATTTPGSGTNRFGIGVRVEATYAGTTQMREVQGGFGYHTAMNSVPAEFGFGAAAGPATVDQLRIRWTDGSVTTMDDVPMDTRVTGFDRGVALRRGDDPSAGLPVVEPEARFFPYRDPVLSDGNTYYYLVDWNSTILVDKDASAGDVVITLR